jgi:ankyrin repeat protein
MFTLIKKDSSGNSIIYYTVCNNDIDNTKRLIDIGPNIKFKGQFNNCLLQISIIKGLNDILKVLLENSNNIDLNNSNDSGRTPLISLIESENFSEKEKLDLINIFFL